MSNTPSFLQLPTELRLQIYSELFSNAHDDSASITILHPIFENEQTEYNAYSILLTNRQVFSEAVDLLAPMLTFSVRCTGDLRLMLRVRPELINKVRKIKLEFNDQELPMDALDLLGGLKSLQSLGIRISSSSNPESLEAITLPPTLRFDSLKECYVYDPTIQFRNSAPARMATDEDAELECLHASPFNRASSPEWDNLRTSVQIQELEIARLKRSVRALEAALHNFCLLSAEERVARVNTRLKKELSARKEMRGYQN